MAPTQLSIVLERLLNELGIADLSTFEAECSTRSEAPLQPQRLRALASARDELAAAQELRRSDCDNLRRAQQAAKRDIKAAERMADQANHAARTECEWRIGEMRAKMQAELREQLDALQISMEAEARRADAAEAERSRLYDKMEGIMRTREGFIDALAEAQRKRREHS
ncbi:hypothetical protein EMIHUDRAFT_240708 [Emiliania huxleyi CCMP1516]|uniref:Nuf2 DHR10-like domain-containing protein n=2 Tax=Emiliania huxleyi TaxID=2903 RepID=A0A0D3JEL5_EMIH1|nr:hypothetical protein EMIHUDRAFT_240708 [Emiliania huxleyi CCMP1516]EOD21950.1 hypothetical protein EMIHUDRAFT_240708 [Emiliania huxleyi CCMP1516]|eukprot:XP_005774379.1 hypothetical protein EMIHUDRAFT_240708 [Emiliania huxleyi CCMP1516]